jgi:hypothetical protein
MTTSAAAKTLLPLVGSKPMRKLLDEIAHSLGLRKPDAQVRPLDIQAQLSDVQGRIDDFESRLRIMEEVVNTFVETGSPSVPGASGNNED